MHQFNSFRRIIVPLTITPQLLISTEKNEIPYGIYFLNSIQNQKKKIIKQRVFYTATNFTQQGNALFRFKLMVTNYMYNNALVIETRIKILCLRQTRILSTKD